MSAGLGPDGAQVVMIFSLSPRSSSIGSATALVLVVLRAPSACMIGFPLAFRFAFSCSSSLSRFCMSLVTELGILLLRKS